MVAQPFQGTTPALHCAKPMFAKYNSDHVRRLSGWIFQPESRHRPGWL